MQCGQGLSNAICASKYLSCKGLLCRCCKGWGSFLLVICLLQNLLLWRGDNPSMWASLPREEVGALTSVLE